MTSDNQVFHWRLGSTVDQNQQHSSMRYYADFKILRESLQPGAAFLSDLATSYYVPAATALSATNIHMHHDNRADFYRRLVQAICAVDKDGVEGIFKQLVRENRQREKSNLGVISYLLINRDEINRNVRGNCLQENQPQILATLGDRLRPLTNGEYIDIYEFVIDP